MIQITCDCCGRESDEHYCPKCFNDLIAERDKAYEEIAELEVQIKEFQAELDRLNDILNRG